MPIMGIIASSILKRSGAFYLIQQLTPSSVSTVTFNSIPAIYKSLHIRLNLVCSTAGSHFGVQFNGDTAANYAYHVLLGYNNSAYTAYGAITKSNIQLSALDLTVDTYPNVGIIDVIDYASTNKNKTTKSIFAENNNTGAGEIEMDSGLWLSTSAVNSLTLLVGAGTFTGTVSLYGIS